MEVCEICAENIRRQVRADVARLISQRLKESRDYYAGYYYPGSLPATDTKAPAPIKEALDALLEGRMPNDSKTPKGS